MSALTSLLVRDSVVPVRKIETVLQRQVISGGDVETILLEMDVIAENVLASYQAKLLSLPPVSREELMDLPLSLVEMVPRQTAIEGRFLPLGVDGRHLSIAVSVPLSPERAQRIGADLGFLIVHKIACDVRISAGLAHHYGAELTPRALRLATKLRRRDPGPLRTVRGSSLPPPSDLELPIKSRKGQGSPPRSERRAGAMHIAPADPHDVGSDEDERTLPIEQEQNESLVRASQRPLSEHAATDRGDDDEATIRFPSDRAPEGVDEDEPTLSLRSGADSDETTLSLSRQEGDEDEPTLRQSLPTDEDEPTLNFPGRRSGTSPGFPSPLALDPSLIRAIGGARSSEGLPSEGLPERAALPPPPLDAIEPGRSVAPSASSEPGPSALQSFASTFPKPRTPRAASQRKRLRGPLTLKGAEKLLEAAADRDEILEVFFSFALQFFDYSAVFSVHGELADGRQAHGGGGASSERLRLLSVPLSGTGTFGEVIRGRAPQVRRLTADEADEQVAEAMGRPPAQPALFLPVSIRQRTVLIFYGDRDGESFGLGDVIELVRFLPLITESFERLILRRKGVNAPKTSVIPRPPSYRPPVPRFQRAQTGSYAPVRGSVPPFDPGAGEITQDTWAAELSPTHSASDPQVDSWRQSASPVASGATSPSELPAFEAEELSADHEMVLPDDAPPRLVLGVPRPPPAPPAPMSLSGAFENLSGEGDAFDEGLSLRTEGAPSLEGALAADSPLWTEGPQVQSSGDESRQELQESKADSDEGAAKDAAAEDAAAEDAAAEDDDDGPELIFGDAGDEDDDYDYEDDADPYEQERHTIRRPSSIPPRPEGNYQSKERRVEVVSSPPPKRASSIPPRRKRTSIPPRTLFSSSPSRSVIVDMGSQVQEQVKELLLVNDRIREEQLVSGLLLLGEAALPELVQEFPGPVRMRKQARGKIVSGRDVSVIARALLAFRERAVPYVASLLSAPSTDERYWALLVAHEVPHPDLIDPLVELTFDADEDVRSLACALLPRFAGFTPFQEAVTVLRRTARLRGKDLSRRWMAVDALCALRDVTVIPKFIDLLREADEDLSQHLRRALVTMTAADFGLSRRRWKAWYQKNEHFHRMRWLIDGLLHGDHVIRSAASDELQRLTLQYYGFYPGAPRRDRERIHQRYLRWWTTEGQSTFSSGR